MALYRFEYEQVKRILVEMNIQLNMNVQLSAILWPNCGCNHNSKIQIVHNSDSSLFIEKCFCSVCLMRHFKN